MSGDALLILIIAIAVLGYLFGRQYAEHEILDRIGTSIGSEAGKVSSTDSSSPVSGWSPGST